MKKIYLSLITLLFCVGLIAQTPGLRTIDTTITDVLAQLPANNQAQYDELMLELIACGEEGILALTQRWSPANDGSNAAVEYAINGVSDYVMADGYEEWRRFVEKAYLTALGITSDKEGKAFLIRQLQIVGTGQAVIQLSGYLSDPGLCGPAARVLATIQNTYAQEALRKGLTTSACRNDIILAIGESGMELDAATEATLLELADDADNNTRKVAIYTLGHNGTKASLKKLADGADKAGYRVEYSGANEAYITLLKRLSLTDPKEAEKAANDLLKKATKAGQTHTRIAAIGILLSINREAGIKQVIAAMKDNDIAYRNAVLNNVSGFANEKVYIELLKCMQKANPDAKVDILNWIAREATCPAKNKILKDLEVRFDLTAQQALTTQLKNNDIRVKEATVWALTSIGNGSAIPTIANLLGDTDPAIVDIAKKYLLSFKGNVSPAIAKVIPTATDAGQIAAVEVLANRKANPQLNTVLELVRSGSPEVKEAAYKGLKDLVTNKNLVTVCGMLESADATTIAPLQQAVISAVASLPATEKVSVINSRMNQAGESKKHLYYVVLAATGDKNALTTIVNGFSRGPGQSKDAAFEALLAWKGIEASDELYEIASGSSNYSGRALDAYIRLVSNPVITGENRLIRLRKAMEIAKNNEQKNTILKQIERTGTYLALLYAGEFLDEKPIQQSAANAVMNIALNNPDYTGDNVRDLLNKVMGILDNPDAGYQKEAIRKHLNEMPAEQGFISIFNGKDLTGWKGLVENPIKRSKMTPAQLAKAQVKADVQMRKDWKAENGMLVFDGTGYDNLCTEKAYGDIEMYVDWMLDPDGPEPDGGIYLRGTPQIQIWDIARVNVGAQVGSGGLYNNQVHPSKPLKVADNKLGEWNTFYIKMVGDRVTVKLNGELVTDDVILENFWDRSQPIPAIEQLELQAHGCKVYYRNIYVKELERPEPFQLSAEEKKEGYQVLFDGTNMHDWTGNTVDYTLEDGCISMIPSKSYGGNLYTKKEYGNFIFRFEFQLTPAANNGLGIRTPMEGDAAYVGMELQILDSEHPVYKDLKEYQYHGSVYGIIPAKRGYLKPVGEWNYQEVIANGDHIKITLNGHVILDGNIREAVKNGTPDGLEHPGLFNKKGHIGFLGHGSPVKFRNIRIKELK